MTPQAAAPRGGFLARLWASPILVLSVTALMFAGHSIAGRLAVGQISPMTLTCGRWALALIPLTLATRGEARRNLAILRPRWPYVVAMGALGLTAFNALFYVAAHRTTALNLSILQGGIPAFVLIGARFAFGARIGPMQALGAAITMAGVVAIASQGDLSRLLALTFNEGDLIMLAACVLYAGYTLGLRNRPPLSGLGFFAAMAVISFLTSVPLMAAEWISGGAFWPSWRGLAALAYAALFPSLLAQILFMRGVDLIGPGRAGVFINLVPVFGALLAVLLLNESFAPYHAVALALVIVGIGIAESAAR